GRPPSMSPFSLKFAEATITTFSIPEVLKRMRAHAGEVAGWAFVISFSDTSEAVRGNGAGNYWSGNPLLSIGC
ncbi:MAG TPA: hypothetical protein VMV81_13460, partial [Phycisphaerae bacterium]|nr:hypothetical protein [Phycisphaerae bacterium]